MKKWIYILCLFFVAFTMAAQENSEQSISALSGQIESSSNDVLKELRKLEGKLRKSVAKQYAKLNPAQLNSLEGGMSFDVPDSLKGVTHNLSSTLDGLLERPLESEFVDSIQGLVDTPQWLELDEWQTKLQDMVAISPPNLDATKNLQVTITEIDKLKELYAKAQIPALSLPNMEGKLPEVSLPKGKFSRLMKKGDELEALATEYAGRFENWEEELLLRVTNLPEVEKLQQQMKRIENYNFLPEGYRSHMEGMQTTGYVKEKLQAKADELKKVGAKTLQEKFDAAQEKMAAGKEDFPVLESLENAPDRKPNPYKGDPFLKRLKLGGDFQINQQSPSSIDGALQVSYLLNENAWLGVGLSYRVNTGDRFNSINFKEELFTTRSFFDYTVYKSLYLEALFERNRIQKTDEDDLATGREWVSSAMLGVGNRFTIANKVNAYFTVLYNFLHEEHGPYQRPIVFRLGFELGNKKQKD